MSLVYVTCDAFKDKMCFTEHLLGNLIPLKMNMLNMSNKKNSLGFCDRTITFMKNPLEAQTGAYGPQSCFNEMHVVLHFLHFSVFLQK